MVQHKYSWLMAPFTDTLISTNNIIMVLHILRFINEFVGSLIDDEKVMRLKHELRRNRYEMVLVTIRNRIEQKWYQMDYCTFEYMHMRLFEYKSSNKGDAIDKGVLNDIFAKAGRMSAAENLDRLITNVMEQEDLQEQTQMEVEDE